MTKDSKFVLSHYLDKPLPPIGTQTEYGKIKAYNQNTSITVGDVLLTTETGTCHEDTLEINSVKLLDCKKNKMWIKR